MNLEDTLAAIALGFADHDETGQIGPKRANNGVDRPDQLLRR